MMKQYGRLLVVALLLVAVVAGTLVILKQDTVRMGFGTKQEMVLSSGTYFTQSLQLAGKYAIVATAGKGEIRFLNSMEEEVLTVNLIDDLYRDVISRAPQMENQILFEEGQKINFDDVASMLITGDDAFTVKLIKR
ncbi:hypothetical protein ACP8HI_10650 [Paenibacillus sp. FA6]|uniref:hypothetical protein n=1 Tax=Paenibacillus sp. FA6 TaxID=3413029 RepID=UPI003F65A3C3